MPRFGAVLFDLDGTLIDSIRLILDSFHHTFAEHGLAPREDPEFLREIGTPLTASFSRWSSGDAHRDAMISTFRAYNIAHHDARVRPYVGAPEAVRALKSAGVRLGVVTSKNRQGTLRGLRIAGLEGVIEALVCSDDVTHAKPHREPVDKAVALLGADPRATIFVGDSLHDMHAGRAAEVPTGAALWGPFTRADLAPSEPTHWLASPDDVVRLALG